MKAIIFDCDGVLVNSEVIYKASERSFLEKVGLFYEDKEFFRRFMGRSEESFFEEVGHDHMTKHGYALPVYFRDNLLAHIHAEFETKLESVPSMIDLVLSVSTPKAVASSSPTDDLHKKLNKTGYEGLFGEHVYSARMVAHGKPEPDLFLYTAENLGIDPKDCLVIEDSQNGVIAAIRAGMQCVGFTGGGHCPEGHDQILLETGAYASASSAATLSPLLLDFLKPAPHGPMFSA